MDDENEFELAWPKPQVREVGRVYSDEQIAKIKLDAAREQAVADCKTLCHGCHHDNAFNYETKMHDNPKKPRSCIAYGIRAAWKAAHGEELT